MTDAYAPVREAAKERQQMSPGRPKKGQEKIPEVFDSIDQRAIKAAKELQTRDIRAKAAGTNLEQLSRDCKLQGSPA